MSLLVWLPLNGDLQNNGLAETSTISTANLSFVVNGKIGKCMSGYTGYFSVPSMSNKKQLSVAYWVRINTATATNWLDAFTWYSTDGTTSQVSRNEFYTNSTYTGFWFAGSPNSISGKKNTVGAWQHHAFVIDYSAGTSEFFINGVSVGKTTGVYTTHYLTGNNFRIGENGLDASYNDFRLYDHALSDREVKELAKGLVAHWKLDDLIGNENLLSVVPRSHSATSYNAYQLKLSENLVAGQTYTMQLWDVDVSHSEKTDAQTGVWIYWGGGSVTLGSWYGTANFTNGHADHLVKIFTVTSANASGSGASNAWLNLYNSVGYVAGTMNMKIGRWKLEKGSTPTPWLPAKTDDMYSDWEFNVAHDSSGYCHDGTVNDSLTCSTDTARYSSCCEFDGVNQSIALPSEFSSLVQDTFTMNLWFKKDELGSKNYETLIGGPSGFEIDTRAGSATTLSLYMASVRGGNVFSPFNLGQWYMVSLVNDGTNELYYIDGELVKTITKKAMPTGTYYIGAWRISSSQNYKGKISDVRVYATALSADDIKELYNTSASIDNRHNVYAREFVEV